MMLYATVLLTCCLFCVGMEVPHKRSQKMKRVLKPDNSNQELSLLQAAFYKQLNIYQTADTDMRSALRQTNPFTAILNENINCDPTAIYRNIDGTCNNLKEPLMGSSKTPFARLVPNTYEDGVTEVRRTGFRSRTQLQSPRTVSLSVHWVNQNLTASFSHLLMNFGQFLDHDFALTAEAVDDNGKEINHDRCCTARPPYTGALRECMPISTANDPVFRTTCIPNLRSAPVPPTPSQQNPNSDEFFERAQMNDNTAWLDSSHIYGSTKWMAHDLRAFQAGRLRARRGFRGEQSLPLSGHNPSDCFNVAKNEEECSFSAGDIRSTEQAGLTSLHTLLLREHNRIAGQLSKINPSWDDETLYQESRKIVIAILQVITYQEFLPVVLGPRVMSERRLKLDQSLVTAAGKDASILHEVATAAFRFGHSLVRQDFKTPTADMPRRSEDIGQTFNAFVRNGELGSDTYLRGLAEVPALSADRGICKGLRDRLFGGELDLMSLNIARGRDHGIGSYMQVRKHYGLDTFNNFDAMVGVTHSLGSVNGLRKVYRHPFDIELFPGGLSELPSRGAILGGTFAQLIGDQFNRLRHGDRFWFQRGKAVGFTKDQEDDIKSVSMARLYCDNVHNPTVRKLMMQMGSPRNPTVSCDKIPSINLSLWRDSNSNSIHTSRTANGNNKASQNPVGDAVTERQRGAPLVPPVSPVRRQGQAPVSAPTMTHIRRRDPGRPSTATQAPRRRGESAESPVARPPARTVLPRRPQFVGMQPGLRVPGRGRQEQPRPRPGQVSNRDKDPRRPDRRNF